MTLLWRLFWSFFKIALLTLGGGFAIIAVADDVFSRRLKWTSEGELVERLSLFQTIPGILAGHCAVYVGQKVAGAAGAAAALTGVVLPSFVIFIAVSTGYASLPLADPWLGAAFAGLRAALAGVIVAMVVRGWSKSVRGVYGHAAVASGCAALASGVNPALVLVGAMAAGAVREYRSPRRTFCSLAPIVPLFLKYGLLAFGGGYVLVPLYMSDFVGSAAPFLQLPESDFANLTALTQMTPGPIGINAATFFGYRLGGVAGACLATAALVLPGALLLLFALRSLARFGGNRLVRGVLDGVRPVTLSLMMQAAWAFAGLSLWRCAAGTLSFNGVACLIAVAALVLVARRRLGVMPVVFLSAVASVAAKGIAAFAGAGL
jgi:chromate transporter